MAESDRGPTFGTEKRASEEARRKKRRRKKRRRSRKKKKRNAYRRNKKTPSSIATEEKRVRKGWARGDGVKIKRYLPARESRDAYIICTSGIARAEQKWLRD